METVLILAVAGAINLLCFEIGVKTAQKVKKGEEVEIPIPNPINAISTREERREAKAEQERIATIIENVDNYNGTGLGQKDVPGR
jgi:hypothetical protein